MRPHHQDLRCLQSLLTYSQALTVLTMTPLSFQQYCCQIGTVPELHVDDNDETIHSLKKQTRLDLKHKMINEPDWMSNYLGCRLRS